MLTTTVLALALIAQKAPLVASPERQKELLAQIQAESQAKAARRQEAPQRSPGEPRTNYRKSSKTARYRAYNQQFQAEQAAAARQQQAYEAKMAPVWAEQQRQATETQLRLYETHLRHKENLDFNNAIRGVTQGVPSGIN